MTSKISFFKLMKEDLKRRSWLIALICLIYLVVLPVLLMLKIGGMMEGVRKGYSELSYVITNYQQTIGAGDGLTGILVIITAVIVGISGYLYLHSKVKMDFYHSLPIPRKKFFLIQYVSGVVMFFFPYLVSVLLYLLIGQVNGLLTQAAVLIVVRVFFFRVLEYLAVYGMAILATVLTGKLITAMLGAAVLGIYIPGVFTVFDGMREVFFSTYMHGGRLEKHIMLFSPVFSGMYAEGKLSVPQYADKWMIVGVTVLILWILLMTGLALWLYCVRKTEAAEHSMAFPKMEGIIKILVVIPLSLAAGLYIQEMASTENTYWFFAAIVCAVLVTSAVIEFIYHLNMREILNHKLQILAAGVITLAIACGFRYDITGYDTYLPAKEDVAQMSIYDTNINGYFCYTASEGGYESYSAESALRNTFIEDFDDIYALAEKAARGEKEEGEEQSGISIAYRLRNGKQEMRSYMVSSEAVSDAYEALFKKEEFIKKIYPVFYKTTDASSDMSVRGMFGEIAIPEEKREEFLEIYKEELQDISYEEIQEHVIASVTIMTVIEQEYDVYGITQTTFPEDGYPICEDFENTIAFLKDEVGVDVYQKLQADEIDVIHVTDYRNDGEGRTIEVEDKEQIQQILDCVKYSPLYGFPVDAESLDIYVIKKNGDSLSGRMWIKKGEAPGFLK